MDEFPWPRKLPSSFSCPLRVLSRLAALPSYYNFFGAGSDLGDRGPRYFNFLVVQELRFEKATAYERFLVPLDSNFEILP